MSTVRFISAPRIQQSLLSPLERIALEWLAEHTPARINSDHLTLLGLASMFACGSFYALSRAQPVFLFASTAALGLNWLGDSLDGTLARYRQQQRPRYGFYVDHLVDVIGTLALMAGMAVSGLMHPWTAVALLVGYYLLFMETFLATYTLGAFRISFGLFSPTELRVLLALGNTVAYGRPLVHIAGRPFLLFDVGCAIGAMGMFILFLYTACRHTAQLFQQERVR